MARILVAFVVVALEFNRCFIFGDSFLQFEMFYYVSH